MFMFSKQTFLGSWPVVLFVWEKSVVRCSRCVRGSENPFSKRGFFMFLRSTARLHSWSHSISNGHEGLSKEVPVT